MNGEYNEERERVLKGQVNVKEFTIEQITFLIRDEKPEVYGFAEMPHYAVLLPLVETEGGVGILFEVRAFTLRRQPGEISFPGGKMEEDETPEKTAIRETSEELGLPEEHIRIHHDLGILVPPYQMAVHTFIGSLLRPELITINRAEVEEAFIVPLHALLSQAPEVYELDLGLIPGEDFPYEHITGGKNYRFRQRKIPEYFFFYEGYTIWGLTARILQQFLRMVKKNI